MNKGINLADLAVLIRQIKEKLEICADAYALLSLFDNAIALLEKASDSSPDEDLHKIMTQRLNSMKYCRKREGGLVSRSQQNLHRRSPSSATSESASRKLFEARRMFIDELERLINVLSP